MSAPPAADLATPHWALGLPSDDADTSSPTAAAPCFAGFWRASELNPTRALLMHQRIEEDAALDHEPSRLAFATAARQLPAPDAAVLAAWAARCSVRSFTDRPLELADLSALLWPMARRPDGGRGLASGGAKYPLQVHVLGWRLADAQRAMAPTLCWHDPLAHGLSHIAPAPAWDDIKPILGVDMNMPAAVLVVTAQAGPHVAKYGERGGRFMLLEAGSWLGAWQAETARRGLGGLVIGAFQDRALLHRLGPHVSGPGGTPGDPDSEHVVAAVYAVGWPSP
jgi:nitroreductase